MNPKTLKLIGCDTLLCFNEEFSINHFYDIVVSHFALDIKYVLHVASVNHDGIPFSEWITFDASSGNTFDAVSELRYYILYIIDKCNKMNSSLASSIVFEDGKDNFDEKVKDICITYYRYI